MSNNEQSTFNKIYNYASDATTNLRKAVAKGSVAASDMLHVKRNAGILDANVSTSHPQGNPCASNNNVCVLPHENNLDVKPVNLYYGNDGNYKVIRGFVAGSKDNTFVCNGAMFNDKDDAKKVCYFEQA